MNVSSEQAVRSWLIIKRRPSRTVSFADELLFFLEEEELVKAFDAFSLA